MTMPSPNDNTKRLLFKKMLLIRHFEQKIAELYPEQEIRTPVHLCVGQEAVAAGVCAHLRPADLIFSTHRNHGHCLAKGMSVKKMLAEFYGKESGCCGGKGGSMHPCAPEHGILGTSAIVGGGIPMAVGAAWAEQMRNGDNIAVAFFGDGATEEGTFHESLNFAALKNIPVVFICENNLYATASPIRHRQPAAGSIAAKAKGYGLPGELINGNDVIEVYQRVGEAVERARRGQGPTLIEAETFRWFAHVGPVDDTETGHRSADELARWKNKCPIRRMRDHLTIENILKSEDEKNWSIEFDINFAGALTFAKESVPPTKELLTTHVFA
ncbi:MAG TPA: thiamine pyrophosphate-dependent dehydrogenase E1 component subunit alpha [Desulfobacterales bacterium]|nr:thiamine pyrophosphate-dependent dehydrogenase E1 component subunit alpha [Desulfobacterales bacterium]